MTVAFAERSGSVVEPVVSKFVSPPDTLVARIHVDRDACVGFVAIGIHGADNVDLAVHDVSGVRLAEDRRPDAHPYVRLCVRAETDLVVIASARESVGPLALLTIASPPVVAPDLATALNIRSEGGLTGPRTPRAAIAQDTATLSAAEALTVLTHRLSLNGYQPVSERVVGELAAHTPVEQPHELGPAGCFGLQVATETESDGLRVELLDASGTVVGATRSPEAQPFVRGCLATGGRYTARLTSDSATHYAMQWFEHPDEARLSREFTGESRAGILELLSVAARHDLRRRELIERVVSAGVPYSQPIELSAGECVFVGAVGAATAVELSVIDEQSAVLAADTSGSQLPRLWVCSQRAQRARVVARAGSSRADFVLLVVSR